MRELELLICTLLLLYLCPCIASNVSVSFEASLIIICEPSNCILLALILPKTLILPIPKLVLLKEPCCKK